MRKIIILICLVILSLKLYAETAKDIQNNIQISGAKSTTIHYTYYGQGLGGYSNGFTRNDSLSLDLTGTILQEIKIKGNFLQSDSELENKYQLGFEGNNWKLNIGDINTGIGMSKFINYNRALTGIRYEGNYDKFEIAAIASIPKGKSKYERILGNGTSGPFILAYAPVVPGSERIFLNNKKLTVNIDYTIDYLTGRVVLKNVILDFTDSLDITYEQKQSIFDRSLYVAYSAYKFKDFLDGEGKIDITGFTEQDSKNNADAIFNSTGVSPAAQNIYSIKWEIDNDLINAKAEYAHSEKDNNILFNNNLKGDAFSTEYSIFAGDFALSGDYLNTSSEFIPLGDSFLGSDSLIYNIEGDYKFAGVFTANGGYKYQNTLINYVQKMVKEINAKSSFKKSNLPYVDYAYYSSIEKNNDNYPNYINQHIIRNTAATGYDFTYINLSTDYIWEKRIGNFGIQPSTLTQGIGININSQNAGAFSLQSGIKYDKIEREATTIDAAATYSVLTIIGNGNFTLGEIFSLNATNTWTNDDYNGKKYNVNTSATLSPLHQIKTSINYSFQTLNQQIVGSDTPVYSEAWSASAEFLPHETLRLSYIPSFNATKIAKSGMETNSIKNQSFNTSYAPFDFLSINGDYSLNNYLLYNTVYVDLPLQIKRDTDTKNISLRISPFYLISFENTYSDKNTQEKNIDLTTGNIRYIDGNEKNISTAMRSSIAEDFSVSVLYGFNEQIQGGGDTYKSITESPYAISDLSETISKLNSLASNYSINYSGHTMGCQIKKRWIKELNSSISMDYNYKEDRIFDCIVKTYAPGMGLEVIFEKFRVNLSYKAGFSEGASNLFQESYSGDISFNPYEGINTSIKAAYSRSKNPDSNATDVMANFGMKF